jgi:hypothetical protein
MTINADSQRSLNLVTFAKQKMRLIKSLGLSVKRYILNGYNISLLAIDGIEKISITAPPGAVVCSHTGSVHAYYYADQYGGDFFEATTRDASAGFVPLIPFSGDGDMIHLSGAGFSAPLNAYGVLTGSWYAPRPDIPEKHDSPNGYIAAAFIMAATTPDLNPGSGYALMRGRVAHVLAASNTAHTDFVVNVMRNSLQADIRYDLTAQYTGYNGHSVFIRPVWGESASVGFSFHLGDPLYPGGMCSTTAGAVRVQVVYQEITPSPLAITYAAFVGSVTQETIATAMGLATPCVSGDDGLTLDYALGNLLGAWPVPMAPYEQGRFSYGVYDICCWGPVPAGGIKGIVFSFDGTATVKSVILPAYNSATQRPVITEVSPGWYCCEVHDYSVGAVVAVYYGNPIDSPGWGSIVLPAGKVVGFSTVLASADRTVATAIVYDSTSGLTILHEYDTSKAAGWTQRGKVATGELSVAAAAVFGTHEYAAAGANDSPVRLLQP